MRKTLLVVAICLFLLSLNNPAFAVSLSLSPASTNAATGDTVSLSLSISGLGNGNAPSLGAFDVNITYDSGALSLNSYSYGSFLGNLSFETVEAGDGDLGGTVNLALVSLLSSAELDALQPDTFVLANLMFAVDALTPGMSTTVAIDTNYVLGDAEGEPLNVDSMSDAVIYNRPATVPEPTTIALFGVGIIGLVIGKKLRRN